MSYQETQAKLKRKVIRFVHKGNLDKKMSREGRGFDYKFFLVAFFALFASAASIAGILAPFGYPLCAWVMFQEKRYWKPLLFSVAGAFLFGGLLGSVRALTYLLMLYTASRILKKGVSPISSALLSGVAVALSGAALCAAAGKDALSFLYAFSEGALCFSLYYVYHTALSCIFHYEEKGKFTSADVVCLSLLFAIVFSGFGFLTVYDVNLAMVMNVMGILLAGYYLGLGAAMSFAALSGLFLMMSAGANSAVISVLCFSALITSLAVRFEKIVIVLLYTAASTLGTYFMLGTAGIGVQVVSAFAGGVLFMIVSALFGDKLLREKKTLAAQPIVMNEAVNCIVREEIDLQKSMIDELSKNLMDFDYKETEDPARHICKMVTSDICASCRSYERCWQDEAEDTYQNFTGVVHAFMKNPAVTYDELPERFLSRCSKSYILFKIISYIFDSYHMKQSCQVKLNRFKRLMTEQFRHLNRVLDKLYGQLSKGLSVNAEESHYVTAALQSEGVAVEQALVMDDFNRRQKVFVKSRQYLTEEEAKRQLPEALSEMLGREIVYDYSINRRREDCDFNYSYTEEYPFRLTVGLARCTKEDCAYSGDNNSSVVLANGLQMVALCDGMGSGDKAAKQSGRVLNMLEELLNAGCDENGAIDIVNAILVLEDGEEIFSTLDLLLFDLNRGLGEFVKAGAAPSYVRRGTELNKVEFDTLPIGILEDTHIHKGMKSFQKGDFIYFMSDGFFDSFQNKEDTIRQTLLQHDYRNPQKVADALFDEALSAAGGLAVDDITVMVVKVR